MILETFFLTEEKHSLRVLSFQVFSSTRRYVPDVVGDALEAHSRL
jgi:hypothetical protein